MNFEDLKNKLKRKFRSFHIGTLGAADFQISLKNLIYL